MTLSDIFSHIFKNNLITYGFSMFSWQHFVLLAFETLIPFILSIVLTKKVDDIKEKVLKIAATTLLILYIFDFFIQPFYAAEMMIHKLPFHLCTATGILIVFVTYNKKFDRLKTLVTVWAVLSPLLWMIFPFSTYESVSLLSYSLIQSILYHCVEFFWGLFMLLSGRVELKWKTIWQPIVGLLPMSIWATIGQELYFPNTIGENFMMLRTDTSGICPQWLYLLALFTAAVIAISLLYLIYYLVSKKKKVLTEQS